MTIAPYLRAAFVNGYAEHGPIPPSDQSRVALLVAIETALDHGDDPELLSAVAEVGKSEGLLALITSRHKAQAAKARSQIVALTPRLAKLTHHDITMMAHAGVIPESVGETSDTKVRKDAIKAVAIAILYRLLSEDPDLAAEWTATLTTAYVAAVAEGQTEAEAMLEVARGANLPDLDALYTSTLASLRDLGATWGGADSWLSDEISGLAGDLGNTLADALEAGVGPQGLLDAANSVISEIGRAHV